MSVDHQIMRILARAYLSRNSMDAMTMATVRQTLAQEMGAVAVSRMDNARVMDVVVNRVANATRAEFGSAAQTAPTESRPATPLDDERAQQKTEPAKDEKEEEKPKKTWITIQLMDENDEPIGGERYKVELPDGSVVEGTLSSAGKATFRDIDPGSARITFFADERPQTWIAVQLVDENDHPVPEEKYSVELPDGTKVEGYLDANGKATLLHVPAGTAKISFTDEKPKNTYVTFQLVDEDDKPIPHEKYRAVLPDGHVVDGVLDDNGEATIRNIDPGTCQVTFYDLEKKPNVSIQLLDGDEKPIAKEKYKMELPNGTEIEGTLDDEGMVTVRHIDWGTSKISFGDDGKDSAGDKDDGGET